MIFDDHEVAEVSVHLVKAARHYQEGGGAVQTGKFFFGNQVKFRNFDTYVRDSVIANEVVGRNGFLGFTLMGLCDALLILTQDGQLEVKHYKALGNQEVLEELHRFFERENPLNNPLTGSGMKALLTPELQIKMKEAGRSSEEMKRINMALANSIDELK